MNERIKLLAEQAGFIKFKTYDKYEYLKAPTIPVESWCLDIELGKFAELIVAECLSVIEEMNPHDPERNIDDIFDEIEEHFGIQQ